MSPRTPLAALALLAGCVRTFPASEWAAPLPRGACRVEIEQPDATTSWTLAHHHADDGRVLSGTSWAYGGRAWERFAYDARGRLAEVRTYEDIDAVHDRFGFDASARRVVTHARVRHDDAGRLLRWTADAVTYAQEPDGRYVARRSERVDRGYGYDDAGRLREIDAGDRTFRFEYDARGRLARATIRGAYCADTTAAYDARDRLTALERAGCTPAPARRVTDRTRYAYDAQGRVVRADRDGPGDAYPSYELFEYRGDRLTRATRVRLGPVEQRDVREYSYDDRGRLAASVENGRVRERRRYVGACNAVVTGPRAPSPLVEMHADTCRASPAHVLDRCAGPTS